MLAPPPRRTPAHPRATAAEPAVSLFYQSPTTGNGCFQKTRPDLLFALAATTQGLRRRRRRRPHRPAPAPPSTPPTPPAQLGLIPTRLTPRGDGIRPRMASARWLKSSPREASPLAG
ncbi:MAG: hypothetical protein R3F65_30250 [bacterium]